MYYLYQIVCHHPDEYGKRYIGFTSNPLKRRHAHFRFPYRRTYLHEAIRRLGAEYFEFQILAEFENKSRALAAEIGLIRCRNTRHPQGYNLVDTLKPLPTSLRMSISLTRSWLLKKGLLDKFLRLRETAQVYYFPKY